MAGLKTSRANKAGPARFFCLCLLLACFHSSFGAVGFYRVQIQPGLNLAGINLDPRPNTVGLLLREPPEGTSIHKLVAGQLLTNTFEGGDWTRPVETNHLGEAVFVNNPTNHPIDLTISGEIPLGKMTNSIPAGLSAKAVPAALVGKLTTELGLRLSAFDNLYLWQTNRFEVFTFLPNGRWHPREPEVSRGTGFLIRASHAIEWVVEQQP